MSKPTPTQAENDLAASGSIVSHEHDGTDIDNAAMPPEHRLIDTETRAHPSQKAETETRVMEPKPQKPEAGYETRVMGRRQRVTAPPPPPPPHFELDE